MKKWKNGEKNLKKNNKKLHNKENKEYSKKIIKFSYIFFIFKLCKPNKKR